MAHQASVWGLVYLDGSTQTVIIFLMASVWAPLNEFQSSPRLGQSLGPGCGGRGSTRGSICQEREDQPVPCDRQGKWL